MPRQGRAADAGGAGAAARAVKDKDMLEKEVERIGQEHGNKLLLLQQARY